MWWTFIKLLTVIYILTLRALLSPKDPDLVARSLCSIVTCRIRLCPAANIIMNRSDEDISSEFMNPYSPQKRSADVDGIDIDRLSLTSPTPKKLRTEAMMPDHSCVGVHQPIDKLVSSTSCSCKCALYVNLIQDTMCGAVY